MSPRPHAALENGKTLEGIPGEQDDPNAPLDLRDLVKHLHIIVKL